MTTRIDIVPEQMTLQSIVSFCKPHTSNGTRRIYINCTDNQHSDITDLDRDRTQLRWDVDQSMWEIDQSALAYAISELDDAGYKVTVTKPVVHVIAADREDATGSAA